MNPCLRIDDFQTERTRTPAKCRARITLLIERVFGPLRQAVAEICFHDRNVAGIYCAVGIHIRAEVCRIDSLPETAFRLSNIGGVDGGVSVYITNEHTHGNGNVAHVCAIIHVHKRNCNSLDVGHASEIDRDLRPATLKLLTLPVPEVTEALPTVTGLAKLVII